VISLDVESLSGNRFLNILFLGIAEAVAMILFYCIAHAIGRRNAQIVCMVTTAVLLAAKPILEICRFYDCAFNQK